MARLKKLRNILAYLGIIVGIKFASELIGVAQTF